MSDSANVFVLYHPVLRAYRTHYPAHRYCWSKSGQPPSWAFHHPNSGLLTLWTRDISKASHYKNAKTAGRIRQCAINDWKPWSPGSRAKPHWQLYAERNGEPLPDFSERIAFLEQTQVREAEMTLRMKRVR